MTHKYVFKVKDSVTPALIVLFSSNVAINSEHNIYYTQKINSRPGWAWALFISLQVLKVCTNPSSDDLFLTILMLPGRVGGCCIHSNICENSYDVELGQCRLILFLLVSICQGKYYITVWNWGSLQDTNLC